MHQPRTRICSVMVLAAGTLAAQALWAGHSLPPAGDGADEPLRTLSSRHVSQPLWTVSGKPTPQALAVIRLLGHAEAYGLIPDAYRVGTRP